MKTISVILFVTLSAIAGIHLYWAMGGVWPAQSEQDLIDTVIGQSSFTSMPPPMMTVAVSVALMAAGFIALRIGTVISIGPKWLAILGGGVVSLTFLARGALGGMAVFGETATALTEPFATLDKWFYSPLCLALGVGFLFLIFSAMRSQK